MRTESERNPRPVPGGSPERLLADADDHGHETPLISFVVPALNEADYIVPLLESVKRHTPNVFNPEVIVVDNGSTDGTVELATENGARVLQRPQLSLGALRNEGAHAAAGRILVFLDADVRLKGAWGHRIQTTVVDLIENPLVVTGSVCLPPDDAGWIPRAWAEFSARRRGRSHLGTGHLIVDRREFLRSGGFDPTLMTGEDFEYCHRLEREGLELQVDPELEVEHVRFPASVPEFIRRERWHGKGDGRGTNALRNSSVARASFVFGLLHVSTAIGVWVTAPHWRGWALAAGAGSIIAVCALGAFRRGGFGDPLRFMQRTVLVYWYLWSRFLAAFGPIGPAEGTRVKDG